MRKALVCGAGGFIGGHLVKRLKDEDFWIRGVDLKFHQYSNSEADDFVVGDLRDPTFCRRVIDTPFDEVYQLAADMGGAGFILNGENDASILYNSTMINLNVLNSCRHQNVRAVLYSSSACAYPAYNQRDPSNPKCSEDSVYPADPDSEYGWEKLFSERLYMAYRRNYGLNIHIARLHNIFGPAGAWRGGREKAPAAICRKVAMAQSGDAIEIWGDGQQTRSFLYIDECIEGLTRLMRSNFSGPVNIGSEEMVMINKLVDIIADIAGKCIEKRHVEGPLGVRGRNSDNRLIREKLNWAPTRPLREGLELTFGWIEQQVQRGRSVADGREAPDWSRRLPEHEFGARIVRAMILLTGYYLERSAVRRTELMQCLRANAAAAEINEIHLLVEDAISPQQASSMAEELRHPKVKLIAHGRRATFSDFFDYANTYLAGHPTVLTNADIYFDSSLARLRDIDLIGRMLCLSRWDIQNDGSARFFEQPASQDAWVFLPPVRLTDCGFYLGKPGCDQRVSRQALEAGLTVSNPSRTIHACHLHLSAVRHYSEAERLGGSYHSIAATHLETPWVWFVITSRNRLADLRHSLPLLVAQTRSTTVLIDYGCAQGTGAWAAPNFPQVVSRYVPDCGAYHGAAARNYGAALADDDGLLCFVDADCHVVPDLSAKLLALHGPSSYLIPDRTGPGWDNVLAVAKRDFDLLGGLDSAFRGAGLEMADLRTRLNAAGLECRVFNADLIAHRPGARGEAGTEPSVTRAARQAIYLAYRRAKAAIAVEAPTHGLSQPALHDIYRVIAAHHWASTEVGAPTVIGFQDTMGLRVNRLAPGVSSHVNDERPVDSLPPALRGRAFTQVVASPASPMHLRFLAPGKMHVLVGTDWDGQWPAREWLRAHGRREAVPLVTTRVGTAFEVWSLSGDAGDEYTVPTQVMLVADELVRL